MPEMTTIIEWAINFCGEILRTEPFFTLVCLAIFSAILSVLVNAFYRIYKS